MMSAFRFAVLATMFLAACGEDGPAETEATRPRTNGGGSASQGTSGASSFTPTDGGAAGQGGAAGADTTSSGGASLAGGAGAGAGGSAGQGGQAGAGGTALVCDPAVCTAPSECTKVGLCCAPQAAGAFGDALVGARVGWTLQEADAFEIEMDFDTLPPTDAGKSVGMFLYFNAVIGGSKALFGVQTDLLNDATWVGRGALFSRLDSSDPANAKIASGGFSTTDPAAKVVGIRRIFPWGLGKFTLRLARDPGAGSAAGHFFTLSMGSVGDPLTSIGSLRFPINAGAPPRISAGLNGGILLYRLAEKYQDVPLWQVGLSLTADGKPPTAATYNDDAGSFLNADVYARKDDVTDRSVVLAFGGKTRRCHPPGKLF